MATVNLSELEGRLLRPAEPGEFTAAELEGLPEPARRHLAQAIAPGAPLATSARLRMRGHIKVGRWLPFRAREVLDPHHGFVWRRAPPASSPGPTGTSTASALWTGSCSAWPRWHMEKVPTRPAAPRH